MYLIAAQKAPNSPPLIPEVTVLQSRQCTEWELIPLMGEPLKLKTSDRPLHFGHDLQKVLG